MTTSNAKKSKSPKKKDGAWICNELQKISNSAEKSEMEMWEIIQAFLWFANMLNFDRAIDKEGAFNFALQMMSSVFEYLRKAEETEEDSDQNEKQPRGDVADQVPDGATIH
jgi:hypothetical protein